MENKPKLTDVEAISILSGIAVNELKQVTNMAGFNVFANAIKELSAQIKILYHSNTLPKQVSFLLTDETESPRLKTVNVLHNMAVEPAGAFMAARDIIAEEVNRHIQQVGENDWKDSFTPSLNACCQVLAHYFFCRATGKPYNEYQAEEFGEQIKKMRVTEALPIAKHFFICYPSLSIQRTGFWHRLLQLWRNGQAYNCLISLNISTP